MSIRPVKRLIKSQPTLEGAGLHLRRAFGFHNTSDFDPFLLLDDFRNESGCLDVFDEFAQSGGQRRFVDADQAFRDAPGTVILVLPKWSSRMTEQDFEIGGPSSKQEEPGALRFPRSHRGR